jgi:diguanylate cyclase (GGDEF)-like protein
MDLDQFKIVNDTCGHVAGDELLRQLSTLLHDRIRQGDTLARLGGDEFGVLLENCQLDHARAIVRLLRETVRDFRFVWEDKTFSIGVSIGVVPLSPDTSTLAAAMSAADASCYVAKDKGRNRVHIYEPDDAELTRRHGEMQWVSRIQDALERDRFVVEYQPIVPTDNPSLVNTCFEILVRMRDENDSIIPPGAFIPAAERYNLMPALDRWVINHVIERLSAAPAHLAQLEFFTINLSGHSLGDEQFLDFVMLKLKASKIPADKLCFEITETAAVANLSRAVHVIKRLKVLGCRFALDDFGSGMSSFAYLKNLPVDFLKIDGYFVRDIVDDPVDHAMVRAINQVGQVMGIRTIAEFVENDAILALLRETGVDYAQGYGIARPAPLDEYLQ